MPDLTSGFDIDPSGNITLKPVLGWMTGVGQGAFVLLQIQYADTPADIGTDGKRIQFVLKPAAALELAGSLTKQAQRLIGPGNTDPD